MRYLASEKAEIIQLVEQSHLPAKRTLDKLGIPRATFYRWYDRYREGGVEALADHRSRPDRVWNRIPDDVRGQIIDLALELLSCRHASWPFGSPMTIGFIWGGWVTGGTARTMSAMAESSGRMASRSSLRLTAPSRSLRRRAHIQRTPSLANS
jgi:hypothetical protein